MLNHLQKYSLKLSRTQKTRANGGQKIVAFRKRPAIRAKELIDISRYIN